VNNVPREEFERLVESDAPPTGLLVKIGYWPLSIRAGPL
jgi:hypothetical protein